MKQMYEGGDIEMRAKGPGRPQKLPLKHVKNLARANVVNYYRNQKMKEHNIVTKPKMKVVNVKNNNMANHLIKQIDERAL